MIAASQSRHRVDEGEPPRFAIEQADVDDVEHIAPLFDAYRQFYGAPPDLAAAHAFLAARLARAESVVLLARALTTATQPAAVVGFAQLYPSFSSVSLGPIVVLNDLFVIPSWRRSSVARSLIAATVRHGERVGAIRIHLSTQTSNAPALGLYRALDFDTDVEFTHMSLDVRRDDF
ncbi:MAG: GNAT family N-acetyltransferase [Gemmatimonadota bacterium]